MYQVIVFRVNDQEYALDLKTVSSILEYTKATPVPNSNPYISGVINVRGEIYSVIDSSKILGGSINNSDSRIILLDNEMKIGLHVQNTTNVITVTEENIHEASLVVNYENSSLIKNVINHNGIVIEIAIDEVIKMFS